MKIKGKEKKQSSLPGQNIFFRRFGLVDAYTTALNGFLLFIVLTYTYPLKFLFTLVFSGDNTYLSHGVKLSMIRTEQIPTLMYVYDTGYLLIYLLFYLMYLHAQNNAEKLELTEYELFETRSQMYINLVNVVIGAIAIILTMILPTGLKGGSGYIYFILGIIYPIFFRMRGKKSRLLFETT